MPRPTYQMLRDFMALPEEERIKAVQHPTLGPMLNDFLNAGGEGRRDILDALRPASPAITPESLKQEVGPANVLEYLKHPEVASTAIRTAPTIGGAMVGGSIAGPIGAAAGGAAGSSLGYLLDQWRTGREVSLPVLGVEAGLGAIPGGRAGTTVLRNVGKRAAQGATIGGAGGTARIVLEEGRFPGLQELLTMLGMGGVLGGTLGGAESRMRRPSAPSVPTPADIPDPNDSLMQILGQHLQQRSKKPKVDKVFKKLSNLPSPEEQVRAFDDAVARDQVGALSRATSPSVDELQQLLIERARQQGNLKGTYAPGTISGPSEVPNPPTGPRTFEQLTPREQAAAANLKGTYHPGTPIGPSAESTLIEALAKGPDEGMAALRQIVEPPPAAQQRAVTGGTAQPAAPRVALEGQTIELTPTIAKFPKPTPPAWYSALFQRKGEAWDGKILGNSKTGFHIRIDEVTQPPSSGGRSARRYRDHALTHEQAAELKHYHDELRYSKIARAFDTPGSTTYHMESTPPGTVELGMGLPMHKVGRWAKRLVQRFDDDSLAVGKLQSGRVQLNRLAPGQKMGDNIMAAIADERAMQGTSKQMLDNSGLKSLSREENINLMQAQEGRARPMNDRVAKVMRAINPERERYSRWLQEEQVQVMATKPDVDKVTGAIGRMRFWKPYQPRANYVPHLPDNREMVKYAADDLAQRVMRFNRGLDPQDARHVAEVLLARANGEPIPRTVPDRIIEWTGSGQPKSAHLFQRTGLVLPDEVRLLPNEAWPAYFQSTSREIALARKIGPADRDIEALRKLVASRPTDSNLDALHTWDYFRGNLIRSPAERWGDKLIAIGRNLATMRFMGPTTALKQASQGIAVAADSTMKNFVKAIGQSFRKTTHEEAARAGAHLDDLVRDLVDRHLTLAESAHPSHTLLDTTLLATERGASKVSRLSGISSHDNFWRTVGYKAAQADLNEAIVAAKRGKASALSLLKEHGLTPASTAQEIDRAAAVHSTRVNLQSNPIALPAIIYKMPLLRLVTHLSRFTIGQQQRMVRDFAVPLVKSVVNRDQQAFHRHAVRLGKLVTGGVLGGEALGDLLRAIAGRPDDRPGGTPQEFFDDLVSGRVDPDVLASRIGDNLLFAAFLGYAQLAKEALLDPTTNDARALRIGGMLLGPVGSSVVEGGTRLSQLLTADTEPNPKTGKSKWDRAVTDTSRTILGSLTGVGRTVSQWTFPHSKGSDKRRAVAGWARAMARDDPEKAKEWLDWYRDRQGKTIPTRTLYEALPAEQQ